MKTSFAPLLRALMLALFSLTLGSESAAGSEPGDTNSLPPCCRKFLPGGPVTDTSLYLLESRWISDVQTDIRLEVLRGRPQIVAMFFTQCEYACPILVNELRRLESALPVALKDQVDFLLVSFDTERDNALTLAKFRQTQHLGNTHWTLLTGQPDDVRELAALLGVNYQKDGRGQFSHSNLITVLNREGEVAHQFGGLQLPLDDVLKLLGTMVPTPH